MTATLSAVFAVALIVPVVSDGPVSAEPPSAVTFDDTAAPSTDDLAPVVADALAASPRSRFVTVDFDALLADLATDDVVFELFEDVAVEFGASGELSAGVDGDPTWSATTPTASASITLGADGVHGSIYHNATLYVIAPADEATHIVYQDGREFADEDDPDDLANPAEQASADARIVATDRAFGDSDVAGDGPPVVRVLVVFDTVASSWFGGDEAARATLAATIDDVNAAYVRSGVNLVMQSAAIEALGTAVNGDAESTLYAITGTSDGQLDGLHRRRDELGADLVVLVSWLDGNAGGTCGIGWRPPVPDATRGFSVVDASCAKNNLTFAHETAHNMGTDHDPANSLSTSYNRGYVNAAAGYRTIMAYVPKSPEPLCAGQCTRLPYFSTPRILGALGPSNGLPLGAAMQDNARVLNENGAAVAAYRAGGPPTPPKCAPTSGTSIVPLSPARLLDSRGPNLTVDGSHSGMGPRPAGFVTEVKVTGRGCVPSNASAVVLNVTIVQAAVGGYASVYPCGGTVPNASNLNFAAGQTVPNAVVAKIGTGGKVCVFTEQEAGLIVDVNGYVPAGSSVGSLVPARLLDTRVGGATIDTKLAGIGQRGAGQVIEVPVLNRGGVPGTASAVMLNVTVVQAAAGGYASVFPCGGAVPNASNLNFVAGQTVPNAVVAKVGTGGKVCVFTEVPLDLLIDVNGYVPAGSSVGSLVPARLLDTRIGGQTVDGQLRGIGVRQAGSTTAVPVRNRGGVPADATAVILNVTAVQADVDGYLTVYPCGEPLPNASNVNYSAGQTVPNAVVAKIGSGGRICVFAEQPTGLLIDVNGYVRP